jgi:hypothetical protein
MQDKNVVVRGPAARELPATFVTTMERAHGTCTVREIGPVTIVAIEFYYLRNNSDLLVVVVLYAPTAEQCDVQILVGGGSTGGFSWGAEGSAGKKTLTALREACEQLGVGVEIPDAE